MRTIRSTVAEPPAAAEDAAGVGHLAAGFEVERRLAQRDIAVLALRQFVDAAAGPRRRAPTTGTPFTRVRRIAVELVAGALERRRPPVERERRVGLRALERALRARLAALRAPSPARTPAWSTRTSRWPAVSSMKS